MPKTYLFHANLIAVQPVPKFIFRIQDTFLRGPQSILWSGLSLPLPLKLPFIFQSKIGLELSPMHFFLPCPLFIFHFLEWSSYLICCLTHLDLGEKFVLLICLERWRAELGMCGSIIAFSCLFGDLLLCSSHASAQFSPPKHQAVSICFGPAVLGCFIIICGF